MLGAYNIDSDDDEEEEEVPTNVPKSASTHIKELEKVSAEIVCYTCASYRVVADFLISKTAEFCISLSLSSKLPKMFFKGQRYLIFFAFIQ